MCPTHSGKPAGNTRRKWVYKLITRQAKGHFVFRKKLPRDQLRQKKILRHRHVRSRSAMHAPCLPDSGQSIVASVSRRNGLCDHTCAWPAETAQASQVEWVQPDHSNGLSNLAKSAAKVKPALRVTSVKAKPWETWSQTLSQTLGKRPASHVTILRTFILQYGIGFLKLNNTSDNEIQGNRFFFFLSLKKFFLV